MASQAVHDPGRLSLRVSTLTSSLARVAEDAKQTFGSLTADQLNWTPAPKRWSIAQCCDHVIRTHSKYFPIFVRLAGGDARMSWWERTSPFSGWLGRVFISMLDPENPRKRKTTPNAMPSASHLGADIIDRYAAHQAEMIALVQRLPATLDPSVIVTSPLLSVVTYSLDDVLVFLGLHARRHFDQARRVMENEQFPR